MPNSPNTITNVINAAVFVANPQRNKQDRAEPKQEREMTMRREYLSVR